MPDLDDTDRRIVRVLRSEGRISNADLAGRVGLSPSACHCRMRHLETTGVIQGYAALIDSLPGEGSLIVVTQITLERQTEEFLSRFETAVRRCPEVSVCFLMTGIADYLLKLKVKDAGDYERLHKEVLSRLPGVARLQSNSAIRAVASSAKSK